MSKLTKIKEWNEYITFVPGNKGLNIDDSMPIEAYVEAVQAIGAMVADGLWGLGDLFLFGERVYGEEYAQVLDKVKYSEKTVKDATWVCATFAPSRRHKQLTFNHHKIVAGLEVPDREELLGIAEKEELSTRELTKLKDKKFPKKKRKPKPAKEGDAEAPPSEPDAVKVTLEEVIEHLDLAIAFFEALDPRAKFIGENKEKLDSRLRVLKKLGRKHDLLGGN